VSKDKAPIPQAIQENDTTQEAVPQQVFADLTSVNPMFAGVLRYFECSHLREPMRSVAVTFQSVAWRMANEPAVDPTQMGDSLDLLLKAKDAAVRSVLPSSPSFGAPK
jgi:hypothetical protein